ncbi:LysR substrate-binding domain-containing protein [Terasakiella sp. A23]|uniref:LysR substrate-binding domain-containing protein n=1 Tax=Terasakiella sp. FCG-A23 TaxID=3080561 RepID=UPI0029530647|nr:LysR substrate-binding domain-containing protein [Terasakiella sp. A23]MDV7338987.1 LysR substrate-binding domain-containing protein [Terasakiella sp. A23]
MKATYTLKHLKYFIAVAKYQHFGQAADACFVTQPTLSAAIKEFEEILGLQLLERTKRSVLITPTGKEVLARAQEIVVQADGLMEMAKTKGSPLTGELRLGVIPTIGPYLLPQIMQNIRSHFPDLTLYLKEDQTERLLESLKEGQLDVLILALPYESDAIETSIFMQDDFFCAVPADHALASNSHIENAEIVEENLLLLEEGHCLRDHAMAACSWAGAKNINEFGATSLSTIVQMVANGLGITLLPKMAIDAGITRGTDLATLPLSKDSPPRDIGLVWRKTSGRGDEFTTLAKFLQEMH